MIDQKLSSTSSSYSTLAVISLALAANFAYQQVSPYLPTFGGVKKRDKPRQHSSHTKSIKNKVLSNNGKVRVLEDGASRTKLRLKMLKHSSKAASSINSFDLRLPYAHTGIESSQNAFLHQPHVPSPAPTPSYLPTSTTSIPFTETSQSEAPIPYMLLLFLIFIMVSNSVIVIRLLKRGPRKACANDSSESGHGECYEQSSDALSNDADG